MSALARIITAAAIGGLVIGGALGLFTASDPEPATLALDAVPVYQCPDDVQVGTLHRGDRVLVTGRNGDWLAVRNVRGSGERVFIRSVAIVPDSVLDDLPEVGCDDVGTVEVASTLTTVVGGTTTTTTSSTTSSTSSTTTTSTTTQATTTSSTSSTTTTTQPPPSVDGVSANPNLITEEYDPPSCNTSVPSEVTISAQVSAPAGVSSVTLSWSSAPESGSMSMSGSGTYTATIGPVAADEDNGLNNGEQVSVSVAVTVVDTLGRMATGETIFTLQGCTFG